MKPILHYTRTIGYRHPSLTGRDNYGLSKTDLARYLKARRKPVACVKASKAAKVAKPT
jgi:hypothetical protein